MYTEITNAAAENKCPEGKGQLPGRCAAMAFPFVAMQGQDPKRYDQREALQQGTLFPGLDLPFHKELKSRFPAANTALSELMALEMCIRDRTKTQQRIIIHMPRLSKITQKHN